MKKVITIIVLVLISIILINTISYGILYNKDTISLVDKEKMIKSKLDSKYDINTNNNEKTDELTKQIEELTQKTTYLLLGDPNSKTESSENYYKRHKDYLSLRYAPTIPEDKNSLLGLDQNSQEFKDDVLSGTSVPGIFSILNELEVKYSSYGKIRVTKTDEENVISTIVLPNVTMKQQDTENPMDYRKIQTDLKMYYFFKKLNGEYKLLYLYGETSDEINQKIDVDDENKDGLNKEKDDNSYLRKIYDFAKADAVSDSTLNSIYEANKDKIVYMNSVYNMGTVVSANGFFINKGIILTTYNFVEKSLLKAQNIIINDANGNAYELDGIGALNSNSDIAVLKVKTSSDSHIAYEDVTNIAKGDAVISINSKTGVGLTSNKGIIISVDKNLQTSLPVTEELQGGPVFNAEGKLIGMANSKVLDGSVSYAIGLNILKEYYNLFSNEAYENVKAVPFNELKEEYYVKYGEENIKDDLGQDKLKEFSDAENAKELIKLSLIKSSYKDGIISLRFRNDVPGYIDTIQMAMPYMESLKEKGYSEKVVSNSKYIYSNDKYQIIVMKEFNYLIIVMVRV